MRRPYIIHIISLGCAKNLVDTEVMCGVLASAGYMLSSDASEADLVLINTCGFIADARNEAEQEIRAALRWKRKGRGRRSVAVAGCLPRRIRETIGSRFPDVDFFVGLDDVERVAELVAEHRQRPKGNRNLPTADAPTYLYNHESARLKLTPGPYAYVKIAEGCDHRCSYCIIPSIRGNQRSRRIPSVVEECRSLLDMGTLELNLIAQDTTRYGADLKDGTNLTGLLRAVDAIDGDFWIRLLYTHPRFVTDELLATMAAARHIVPYIDIPLQHISTPVLRAMRRGLDGDQTRTRMTALRNALPGAVVRTTFLVGFPGETEDDFNELLDYVREYRFDRLGAFAFSPEEGTPAATVTEGIVPPEEAARRRDLLLETQQQICLERNRSLVGKTCRVLLEGPADDGIVPGRSEGDAPDIDNLVHVRNVPPGEDVGFATVRITEADPYDLQGEYVGP